MAKRAATKRTRVPAKNGILPTAVASSDLFEGFLMRIEGIANGRLRRQPNDETANWIIRECQEIRRVAADPVIDPRQFFGLAFRLGSIGERLNDEPIIEQGIRKLQAEQERDKCKNLKIDSRRQAIRDRGTALAAAGVKVGAAAEKIREERDNERKRLNKENRHKEAKEIKRYSKRYIENMIRDLFQK